MLQKLFDSATMAANGAVLHSSLYELPDYQPRTLFVGGEFAGAQVQVEVSPDGRTWFNHAAPLLAPATLEVEDLQPGVLLRLAVLYATADTVISAWI